MTVKSAQTGDGRSVCIEQPESQRLELDSPDAVGVDGSALFGAGDLGSGSGFGGFGAASTLGTQRTQS